MYERVLKTMLILLFMFLLVWVYPGDVQSKKTTIDSISKKVLVSSRVEKKIVGYTNKIVLSHQIEEKEVIGQELVNTGRYKRIEYLGRYERQEKKTNDNNREYVLIASRRQIICIKECLEVNIYSYDEYSIKMIKELKPIYKINTIDVYKNIEEPIYKEEIINEYKEVTKPIEISTDKKLKTIFLNTNKLVF
jgi:hypothetical protein